MAIASVNPASQVVLKTFETLSLTEINQKLALASTAFERHRHTSFADRAKKMTAVADWLDRETEALAKLMAIEMGKPIQAGRDEIKKCALCCRHYAEHAAEMLAPEPAPLENTSAKAFVRFDPIGPVLAIMPWNFPFWQVLRFAAPTVMAGNVGLLKHASNVPQCALAIERAFIESGFEPGVFQTLLVGSDAIEKIIEDPRIEAVTLTGSNAAGAAVAATAGRSIKKTVLELGGSDPFIVCASADVELAAKTATKSRVINSGQSCIAAKRFLVDEKIADRFEAVFAAEMRALKVGDPLDAANSIGPLATPSIVEEVERQVRESIAAGARVVCGGKRIPGPGNYFEPTILTDLTGSAPVRSQEVFGPVAALIRFKSIEEAILIANETEFGLGASVWTRDDRERDHLIGEVRSGMIFVNSLVASDPRVPFGGTKRSGYGRELSKSGIREFVNAKTVWIAEAAICHAAR